MTNPMTSAVTETIMTAGIKHKKSSWSSAAPAINPPFTMRISLACLWAALPALCFAAKRSAKSGFEQYQSQFLSSPPLKLDDAVYDDLTRTPRNYSVVVLLTALEARFGCQLCRDFQPEWDLLARSWARGDKRGESRFVLGTLDFSDGKGTFQKVRSHQRQIEIP